ncbi:MAG: ATP-binding protein [Pseudomonadota bacterium]|nr:ATP-binding protein [Pseudomonadota bacterium]
MKRTALSLLPVLGLFALLLISLYLLGEATQNAARFGHQYIGLLLFNALLLVALVSLLGVNLVGLIRQVAGRQPGSRLTLRLMLISVALAVVPAAIVYGFSIKMLDRGIDSWFDVRVEHALDDALDLSRSSVDLVMRQLKRQTEPMVRYLTDVPDALAPVSLHDLLRDSGAVELTLFSAHSRIIATSSMSTAIVPSLPSDTVMRLVSQGESYVGLDRSKGFGLRVRLVFPVPATADNPEPRFLQALYPLTDRIGALAGSVERAFSIYDELIYLREPLKQSFMVTLSLVLLLALLFAAWAAFYSARRLMAPISELAEGTKAVAQGEYHKRLPVGSKDDLGLLVASFNQMTERLSAARDAAERSQLLVESQRAYLQALLEHLSSGVMSLDAQRTLRTVNAAANHILGVNLESNAGRTLPELAREHPMLARFCETLEPLIATADREWQEQVVLFSTHGRKILICRGAPLPADSGLSGGHVLVFDDVTALVQAQRDAAWGDVARRLAHEIKNPLTPIQLSAERLRRKLLPQLDRHDAEVVDRATHTIVQQVESMKTMVNAFGDYARPPAMQVVSLNLNKLILEVAELYQSNPIHARLELNLDNTDPHIEGDAVRIRQLLHNLIQNALEALESSQRGRLRIGTRCVADAGGQFVDLRITDNGPGFPTDLMDRLFEPYVTSKIKGNGLGLAIVKKIVEEHGGVVWAQNTDDGASVRIRLLSLQANRHAKVEGDAA